MTKRRRRLTVGLKREGRFINCHGTPSKWKVSRATKGLQREAGVTSDLAWSLWYGRAPVQCFTTLAGIMAFLDGLPDSEFVQ